MEYRIIGESYACHTGGRARLSEEGVRIAVSGAPDGAELRVNGRSYPIRAGIVQLPDGAFRTGINKVSLLLGGRTIPAEGILSTGGGICPAGVSLPDVIRALDNRIAALDRRLGATEEAVLALADGEGLF